MILFDERSTWDEYPIDMQKITLGQQYFFLRNIAPTIVINHKIYDPIHDYSCFKGIEKEILNQILYQDPPNGNIETSPVFPVFYNTLVPFINKNISLRIDLLTQSEIRVLIRIATSMLYTELGRFPRLVKNNYLFALIAQFQRNVYDSKREWDSFYATHFIGLPF